ncbi:hypothetical protein J7400_18265 [Shimia sp. R9_2]|uniref:nickel/cobalt transporter n=1 Tax=Shimia sp. R9_2 TaxID=2821112 RepID=UPI001AD9CF7A|nr:hypothetical protein [Shimia sp. R9_2]MBO9398623.1 hypothetical protein [Shimia sp. R9_2]
MRVILSFCVIAALALAVFWMVDFSSVSAWALEAQRGFQNQMAGTVRALKMGEPGAYFALLSATAAYGFVHALGPGHGKYLVGGVGLGTEVSAMRLLSLAVASSLAQALWAIILVYGGFSIVQASAQQMTGWTEDILAPASYLAISCVGLAIIWRGARALPKSAAKHSHHREHSHDHAHDDCGCGHAHGPTAEEAARLTSVREAIALILSIAIRPCTGAVFLLVIAWQMDIKTAGALAVVVMGLGTAALTSLVAVSSTAARRLAVMSSGSLHGVATMLPALQMLTGLMILIFSLGLLGFTF